MPEQRQALSLSGVRLALSAERMDSYGIGIPDEDRLANYLWNVELCQSLYPALHGLEIALRNAVFRAGAAAFPHVSTRDVPCWLDADPALILPEDQRRVDEATARLRSLNKPLDPGQLVAELGLGFWATLFDVRYERGNRLWPRLFAHGLMDPGSPRSVRTRKRLSPMINRIRYLRNRVFHHKPVWHWQDLAQHHAQTLDLLGWLSPSLRTLLEPGDRFADVLRAGAAPFRERVNALRRHDGVSAVQGSLQSRL